MAGRYMGFLLLLLTLVVSFTSGDILSSTPKKPVITSLEVKTCPKMDLQKNVDKNRLLGVWFAYATTPLDNKRYKRRCTSYNVANNTYFKTNILFTDYDKIVITYACKYNDKTKLNDIKLRVLTHTRSPEFAVRIKAIDFLDSISFPVQKLIFLKSMGFCFEWYLLQYHQRPRPGTFNVPINVVWDHR